MKTLKNLTADEIGKKLNAVNESIEAIDTELSWLKNSSAPKSDVIKGFDDYIDLNADMFNESLSPSTDLNRLLTIQAKRTEYGGSKAELSSLLCGLFAEEMKATLKAKINRMDWEAGPAMAGRPDLIKNLGAKKILLQAEQVDLIEAANQIGLNTKIPKGFSPEILLGFSD